MKKRLLTLALAFILCLGIFPLSALAGQPVWTGGNDPKCKHLHATGAVEWLDETYHQFRYSCPDCGAKGTLPFDEPQHHNWQTYVISPGNPDGTFPYGGEQEYCPDCGGHLDFYYGPSGTLCSHPHKTQISTIDPGMTGFPYGGKIYQCDDCKQTFEVPNDAPCEHKNTTKKWDSKKHWDECDDCHEKLNATKHVRGARQKDDKNHWYACKGCAYHMSEKAHKAQYTKYNDTNHWKECSCGFVFADTQHKHEKSWDYNETYHWQTCTCGWTSKQSKHKLVDQPDQDGKIVSKCSCGYSTTRTAPTPTGQVVIVQTPTPTPKPSPTGQVVVPTPRRSPTPKPSPTQAVEFVQQYKLSINCIAADQNDQHLMPMRRTEYLAAGSYYKRLAPTVDGFTANRSKITGIMPQHDVEVVVVYTKNTNVYASDYYRLTVNYVAADPKYNDQMPPSHTEFHKVKETYVVFSPAVSGLTPTEKVVQGTMPNSDLDVTVTYSRKYTLTIKMVFPGGDPEAQFQDGGIWMEKFELDDGTAYSYSMEDLFTTEALMSDVNLEDTLTGEGLKGSWFTADIIGISAMIGQLQDSGAIFTPDRDPVEGKIEGADKLEIVKLSCPHPDEYLVYSSNEDGTHDFKCDLCGEILLENEACNYYATEYTVSNLPDGMSKEKYPNGATQYQCPLCKHEYWVNPDDEPCPESPEGLPHIWTLWYPADENHCHRTCARCGLDVTEPHDWSSWTSMGGLHHYRKCSHCKEIEEGDHGSWKNVTVTSPATCIENAKVDATCGVCNARITNVSASLLGKEYLATGHDFENGPWHIDGPHTVSAEGAGGHYKSCAVCGVTDREHMTGHTWGGKTVISAGVCDDPSQKHVEEATCTACGAKLHSETEVHHDQVRYPEGDIAATCEDYGKEAYKCSVCNTVFGDAIPPLGHDMQVVEKKDADCEHEGYIKRKCSRCNLEETEVLEKKSKSGKHQWVPNVSIPDCLLPGEAKGETCSVCGATQAGNTGFETFPALGHKVKKETRTVGRTREYVSDNGVTTCTCYEVYYICERCGHALGHEYYTVGTNPNISRYQIEPGKNVRIDDVSGGIHIDGNMANDGGVCFNEEVKKGVNDLLDWAGEKYVWKKTPANSYIIEFTEEFMNELEDGEYPLEVTNGDEYWPMIVVVKDHKFVDIKTMPEDDTEHFQFTSEQFDAWKRDVTADGTPLKEYTLGCPAREGE